MDSERDESYDAPDVADAVTDAQGLDGADAEPRYDADALGLGAGPVADPLAAPKSRLVLGTLAGLGVVLVGITAWSLLYAFVKRDYVGVSVVFALGIGYVVREVSRRSDLVPRIVSAVLAAILCVFGSVIAQIANTAREFPEASFWDLLVDLLPDTFSIVSHRNALTFVIFAAAVVVAFLSAGPSKPAAPKAQPAPADDEHTETE